MYTVPHTISFGATSCFVTDIAEILHRLRHSGQATGTLCAGREFWDSLPHLATGHFSSFRKLHYAPYRGEHYSTHAQGIRQSTTKDSKDCPQMK